jgi:hypothetical protein
MDPCSKDLSTTTCRFISRNLISVLRPVVGINSETLSGTGSRSRKLSVAACKRIAAAQRARWAKVRAKKAA